MSNSGLKVSVLPNLLYQSCEAKMLVLHCPAITCHLQLRKV